MKTFMEFMHGRLKHIDMGYFDPRPINLKDANVSAHKVARRDPTDPFIYGRALNLLQLGIVSQKEVEKTNVSI